MVVADGVGRRDRPVLLVDRRGADELVRRRTRERVDRMLQPELRERLCFAGACSEPGPPQESLGLLFAERAVVLGQNAHVLIVTLIGNWSS